MEIRTALPFGYLIFAIALGVAVLTGIGLLMPGVHRRSPGVALAGAAVLLAAAAVAVVNLSAGRGRELNPTIRSASDLLGVWTGKHLALELRDHGAYVCRGTGCKDFAASGSWARRGDFELELSPTSSGDAASTRPLRFRVIEYRGRLQLTEAFEDADMWDGQVIAERIPPAA